MNKELQIAVLHRNKDHADYGFVSGLLKTAQQENPKIAGKIIGVDSLLLKEIDSLVEILESEQKDACQEVRYVKGVREVKRVTELNKNYKPETTNQKPLPIREGGVYLITGGAGGLGKIFAEDIAKIKGTKIILTGRSKLDKEKKTYIENLQAEYYTCDVSDKQSVENLVRSIKEKHGKLDGIIHSAGVIRDSFILKKTAEEAKAVLSPKIQGVRNLDQTTKTEALDFVVYFSSITAVLGNAGQSDYAAANAYMDNFATYRNALVAEGKRHGKTLSINWPLWADGGMQIDEQTKSYLERSSGMKPLPTQEGMRSLEILLNQETEQGIVVYGFESKIAQLLTNQTPLQKDAQQNAHLNGSTAALKHTSPNSPDGAQEVAMALGGELKTQVIEMLKKEVSDTLKIAIDDIDEEEELSEFGFDSIMLTSFSNKLNQTYDIDISPALFFEYNTIASLGSYLIEAHQAVMAKTFAGNGQTGPEEIRETSTRIDMPVNGEIKRRHRPVRSALNSIPQPKEERPSTDIISTRGGITRANEPIAIVGYDALLPGANNADAFWDNIFNQRSAIHTISRDQWHERGLVLSDDAYNSMQWAACLATAQIKAFDADFFGIEHESARLMDPMQRLLLHSIWHCVEFSGYSMQALSTQKTGLFIGAGGSQYRELIAPFIQRHDLHSIAGLFGNMLVNRLSYLLNLRGPSEVIDTACSSVYVAIHRAIKSLQDGECDTAIVSGASIHLSPHIFQGFSEIALLSKTGTSHAFDHRGNGYVRGEGVGTICLKPLSAAVEEGAHIYGVIHGTGVSHNGAKSLSLIAPDTKGQTDAMLMAYRNARFDPAAIQYIEAHGTGTPMADASEIAAFKEAFRKMEAVLPVRPPAEAGQAGPEKCGFGSVKGNVGHLELASGIPSLVKVLQAYRHNYLPPIQQFEKLPPTIHLDDTPFYVVDKPMPWEKPTTPGALRYASLHSFGFGGVNAHVVLSDYANAEGKPKAKPREREELIVISAKNRDQLSDYIAAWETFIQTERTLSLADLAYTSQVGRDSLLYRAAMLCRSQEDLQQQLAVLKEMMTGKSNGSGRHGNVWVNIHAPIKKKRKKEIEETKPVEPGIRAETLQQLATSWISGKEIDWEGLYRSESRKRVIIPVYPFTKKPFWIEEVLAGS